VALAGCDNGTIVGVCALFRDTPKNTICSGTTLLSFPRYSVHLPRLRRNLEPQEERMDFDNDSVGGYAVPVDPMDLLQCDSCQ